MNEASETCCHVVVRGLVQGVFFRRFVQEEARGRELRGAVWNRPDGAVEVIAEGAKPAVEQLIERVRQGPPASRVDEVTTRWKDPSGAYRDFSVAHP
ncbi:acylphosphatase [candidate division WOR-3 bacterium]|nr:acylphosphatase [candidate division WOR-3 bacterium]